LAAGEHLGESEVFVTNGVESQGDASLTRCHRRYDRQSRIVVLAERLSTALKKLGTATLRSAIVPTCRA